jgi:hypothetical protein
MKTFLIALVFLIIGGSVAAFVALGVGTGMGVATGLAAGACATLQAAREQGLVSDTQADQVLSAAVATITGGVALPPEAKLAATAADCERVLADLKEARAGR